MKLILILSIFITVFSWGKKIKDTFTPGDNVVWSPNQNVSFCFSSNGKINPKTLKVFMRKPMFLFTFYTYKLDVIEFDRLSRKGEYSSKPEHQECIKNLEYNQKKDHIYYMKLKTPFFTTAFSKSKVKLLIKSGNWWNPFSWYKGKIKKMNYLQDNKKVSSGITINRIWNVKENTDIAEVACHVVRGVKRCFNIGTKALSYFNKESAAQIDKKVEKYTNTAENWINFLRNIWNKFTNQNKENH